MSLPCLHPDLWTDNEVKCYLSDPPFAIYIILKGFFLILHSVIQQWWLKLKLYLTEVVWTGALSWGDKTWICGGNKFCAWCKRKGTDQSRDLPWDGGLIPRFILTIFIATNLAFNLNSLKSLEKRHFHKKKKKIQWYQDFQEAEFHKKYRNN